MLTESVALSCCGAVLGVILAVGSTRFLARQEAINIPLLQNVRTDSSVLGFAVLVAVLTGLTFGLVPAFHVPGFGVREALNDTTRSATRGKRRTWIRGALVIWRSPLPVSSWSPPGCSFEAFCVCSTSIWVFGGELPPSA